MTDIKIEAVMHAGNDGKPLTTVTLANGMRRHTMSDGRVFEEDGPVFRMEYMSYVTTDKPYTRDIAVFGLANKKHLFEAWCYTYNALRTYAFCKVVSFEEIETGIKLTGEELRVHMGGTLHPQQKRG